MVAVILLLVVLIAIWIAIPRILILLEKKNEGCLFILIFVFILFMIVVFLTPIIRFIGILFK